MKRLLIALFIIFFVVILYAAYEDYTTYTEVDILDRITVEANRITYGVVNTRDASMVYKSFGEDYFDANFTMNFTVNFAAIQSDALPTLWMLANIVESTRYMKLNENFLAVWYYDDDIVLVEYAERTEYTDKYAMTPPCTLYLTIVRDETTDFGLLYCCIYSDFARTTLLDSLSITLHEKQDFQYLYAYNGYDYGSAFQWSGYTENLEILKDIPASPSNKNVIIIR